MTTFSIITITLNNRHGLEKTIKSVISQSNSIYEFIIIDGASTDGSIDVIRKYESHISYWISEKDDGIYNAMNKGISVSQGKYLFFLNSGDYFYNSHILEQVSKYDIENYDIFYGNVQLIGSYEKYINEKSNTRKINTNSFRVYPNGLYEPPIMLSKHNLFYWTLPHQGTFFKKELFLSRKNYYNETYKIASDYDFLLWAFLKKKASFLKIDETISYYDLFGLSATNKTYLHEENEIIKKIHFGILYFYIQKYKINEKIKSIHKWFVYPKFTIGKIIILFLGIFPKSIKIYLYNKLFKKN